MPGVAQCPKGVLRSLLGRQLMGTSLLRNWMSLVNPLQTSVEVHCQSQLGRRILLSHVLTTPGWSSCRVFTLCGEFSVESAELSPKEREAEGPQLMLHSPLMSSAGLSFPASSPCTMQRLLKAWASSFSQLHLPVSFGCFRGCKSILPGAWCPPCPPTPAVPVQKAGGAARVGELRRAEASAPPDVDKELLPCRSHEVLSSHHLYCTHNHKAHEETIPKKRKGASRTYLRCLNYPKVKTNLESKEMKLLL